MTDWRQKNIDTYNQSAEALAEYFRGIGPRTTDIELALELAGNPEHARVVEIGCGDGRDAKEIVEHVGEYHGFDISEEAIKLARKHVPGASFEVSDVKDYQFPDGLDVIYSFASLLHSRKEDVGQVLARAATVLRTGGIFMISLKRAPQYEERIKRDRYGERLFYFYTPELVQELAGNNYETADLRFQHISSTDWFAIVLQKV